MGDTKLRVLHKYDIGGRAGANVLHYDIDIADVASPAALATTLASEWADEMVEDATASAVTYTGCIVTDEAKTFMSESVLSKAGTATGEMAGPAAAFLVRYSLAGTTTTGRSYLPGVPENAIDSYGNLTGGTISYIEAQYEIMRAKLEVTYPSIEQVVKLKSGSYAQIIDRNVDSKMATQRRRLRG